MTPPNKPPLCVDLDGTLIHTDLLHESVLHLLRHQPWLLLLLPFWLLHGRAYMKQRIAERAAPDFALLPYNAELVEWIARERASGRQVVLCTASDQRLAQGVHDHLRIFDRLLASDGVHNLAGTNKAATLVAEFGEGGFDYAGNSQHDVAVWRHARSGIVVGAAPGVAKAARAVTHVEHEFTRPRAALADWQRMLRAHQWLKNLLLLVPLLAAHRLDALAMLGAAKAFVAFSLIASTVYITNDLLDLDSDRAHPRKRNRPFASGRMPITWGVALAPLLALSGSLVALSVNPEFVLWLAAYFALTLAYSFGLKRIALLDGFALAGLYTLRIVAGGAATATPASFWLLAFSVFLFLSLAFVKRYAELATLRDSGHRYAHGRGYRVGDTPIVMALGLGAAFSAVLVLALYLDSAAVRSLYAQPGWLWACVLSLCYWICHLWFVAHRGNMHDDPVVFALRDRGSLATGALFAVAMLLGAGWKP